MTSNPRSFVMASLVAVASCLSTAPARADAKGGLLGQRARVTAATVTLPQLGCAGAVAGARTQVVTAAHCVPEGVAEVDVAVRAGDLRKAWVAYIDRDADLALLRVDEDIAVEPLRLSDALPAKGSRVLFVGRVDRASRTQIARIERFGRCPGLPSVDQALFTNIVARPGDSGAPLVDASGSVVGLIHGGTRCHIAVPTAALGEMWPDLDVDPPSIATTLPQAPTPSQAPSPAPSPATPQSSPKDGSNTFVWESTKDGVKFQFHFTWSWNSNP